MRELKRGHIVQQVIDFEHLQFLTVGLPEIAVLLENKRVIRIRHFNRLDLFRVEFHDFLVAQVKRRFAELRRRVVRNDDDAVLIPDFGVHARVIGRGAADQQRVRRVRLFRPKRQRELRRIQAIGREIRPRVIHEIRRFRILRVIQQRIERNRVRQKFGGFDELPRSIGALRGDGFRRGRNLNRLNRVIFKRQQNFVTQIIERFWKFVVHRAGQHENIPGRLMLSVHSAAFLVAIAKPQHLFLPVANGQRQDFLRRV